MNWTKGNTESSFVLLENNETILQMNYDYKQKGNLVSCKSKEENFTIMMESFWKTNAKVIENDSIIGRTYTEKWFSSSSVFEIKGQKIYYKYRNNPLAELVFYIENETDFLLSCGLKSTSKGNVEVQINVGQNFEQNASKNYILALCWYIFQPIAQENTMDYMLLMTT